MGGGAPRRGGTSGGVSDAGCPPAPGARRPALAGGASSSRPWNRCGSRTSAGRGSGTSRSAGGEGPRCRPRSSRRPRARPPFRERRTVRGSSCRSGDVCPFPPVAPSPSRPRARPSPPVTPEHGPKFPPEPPRPPPACRPPPARRPPSASPACRTPTGGRLVDAELIALRVLHHAPLAALFPHPVAARSRRAFEPGHLLVAPAGAGMKVEVETVLGRLGLRHPLEEQPSPEPPAGRPLVRVVRMPDGGQIPPLRGGRATRWSGPRGLCPAPADPRRVRGPVAAAPCVRRRAVRPRPPWGGASSAHGRSAARARRRVVRPSPIARRQAAGSGRRAVDDPGTAGASGAVPAAAAARASAARRAASARVRRA